MRPTTEPSWLRGYLAAALLLWGVAAAQPGLYGPEAPSGAAWVRIVNAAAPGGIAVRVGDGATVVVPYGHATRYHQVPPGAVALDLGGTHLDLEVEPASFTTVAITPAGPATIVDPALRDVSRGLLGLLNLTDRPLLDLRVPDGTTVVADVGPGTHEALVVAQASTELLVTEGDRVVARIPERLYARGVAYAVVVVDTPDGPLARVVSSAAD
jgi:alginate O-acetyltransferase complex protein AlgF